MFDGMTIRTEYFQISRVIIPPIPVAVMYNQDFRVYIVVAAVAFHEESSPG